VREKKKEKNQQLRREKEKENKNKDHLKKKKKINQTEEKREPHRRERQRGDMRELRDDKRDDKRDRDDIKHDERRYDQDDRRRDWRGRDDSGYPMRGRDRKRARGGRIRGRAGRPLVHPHGSVVGVLDSRGVAQNKLVDKKRVSPFLVRVFFNEGKHFDLTEYAESTPESEIRIYAWMDLNLRTMSDLIKDADARAKNRESELLFAMVYPDLRTGAYNRKELGYVHAIENGEYDKKTLEDFSFRIGHYMSVALSTPRTKE